MPHYFFLNFKILKNTCFVLMICALVQFSCTPKGNRGFYQKENAKEFKDIKTLVPKTLVEIPLDKESGFFYSSLQVSQINGKEYISFLNTTNNSIYIYLLDSTRLDRKIKLKTEPLASHSGHLVVNLDSSFVYSAKDGRLLLFDSSGTNLSQLQLIDFKNDTINSVPEAATPNRIIRVNKDLYFSCQLNTYRQSYEDFKTVLKVSSESKQYLLNAPPIYNQSFWGEIFKYTTSVCYNSKEGFLLLNYPADPFLYKASLDGKVMSKHFVGSKYFNEIDPMSDMVSYGISVDRNIKDIKRRNYSFSTSDYSSILYDSYQNFYYRVAFIRPSASAVKNGRLVPDFSIIVLDSNFSKIGEKRFSSNLYNPSMILISKSGICLFRKDLYDKNDSVLPMEVFKIENNDI